MNILNLLTGKAVENVAKGAMVGVDALVLTEEERLKLAQKAAEIHLEITKAIATESTPTAVSRRLIALLVICPYVLLKLLAAALVLSSEPYLAEQIDKAAAGFEYPTLAVVAFYFGGHIVSRAKGR